MGKRLIVAMATLLAVSPALAQSPPAPTPPPARPLPNAAAPNTTAPGAPGAPAAPPAATPDQWLPRGGFELRALDKVNARPLTLTGRVGDSVKYGSLTITVRSCIVRPPDQEADAAAFLDITDARPDAPGFHGWMFANEPALSMFEHPVYDIRVAGCRP